MASCMLSCCKSQDENTEGIEADQSKTPFRPDKRRCTDVLCTLFFLLFWTGMIIIAAVGYKNGEPKRLVYGTDWLGRTCGVQEPSKALVPAYDFRNYKYLMYPRLAQDVLALQSFSSKTAWLNSPSNLKKLYGVCLQRCPKVNDSSSALYVHAYKNYTANPDIVNTLKSPQNDSVEDRRAGSPWRLSIDSTDVFYRCLQLSKVEYRNHARCVDDCTAEETEAYKRNGYVGLLTCGKNITSNPYRDCGSITCPQAIANLRSNCSTIQVQHEETSISAADSDEPIIQALTRGWNMAARWIGDVQKASVPIFVCGCLVAVILGFLWLGLLRLFAGFFVWLVIVLVIIMLLALTFFTAYQGDLLGSQNVTATLTKYGISSTSLSAESSTYTAFIDATGLQTSRDTIRYWSYSCYVIIVFDVIVFLSLIFMCGRIKLAIGIIREASKALQCIPSLVFYPIIPTVFATALFAYWIVAAAYITTSANVTVADVANTTSQIFQTDRNDTLAAVNEIKDNRIVNYLLIYHLLGLLWTSELISSLAFATVSGAFCEYYWTKDKSDLRSSLVVRSGWRTLRYHFGSMAFGSLIISLFQMLRIGLEYLDRKTRNIQKNNVIIKAALFIAKCILWIFEKCLKFLNRNAYIVVAMNGKSFCPAMTESFKLFFDNVARVATVGIISKFLLFLGKLFIASTSTLLMFIFIRYPPKNTSSFFFDDLDDISSPIFPMLLTGLLSFAVGSFFLDIYGTGIDTILLCFCKDSDMNKSTGSYYMSNELLAYINGPVKKNSFLLFKVASKHDAKMKDANALALPVTRDL